MASKGEERQTGGKGCSLGLIFKILSGSFTIVLQGGLRTNISELVCKHQVWPEAQRLGTSHFHFLRENLVEGTDTHCCIRRVKFQRFLLKASVQVS